MKLEKTWVPGAEQRDAPEVHGLNLLGLRGLSPRHPRYYRRGYASNACTASIAPPVSPQASCVAKLDRPAVERRWGRDYIASGAWPIEHDRPLVPQQRVEQAAFADVRLAGQRDAKWCDQVQAA